MTIAGYSGQEKERSYSLQPLTCTQQGFIPSRKQAQKPYLLNWYDNDSELCSTVHIRSGTPLAISTFGLPFTVAISNNFL